MAGKDTLKKCLKCGAEVFEEKEETKCPKCEGGVLNFYVPTHKKKNGHPVLVIFFLILMFSGMLYWGYKSTERKMSKPPQPITKQTVEIVRNSPLNGSVRQVKDWMEKNLKDPDSVEYIEWSPVQKMADRFVVRCKYRAKNSFGGFVIENKLFKMDLNGNIFDVQDIQ